MEEADKVIGEIQKNEDELLRVGISEYKGKRYFYIRIFYLDSDEEWKPTKKGVTVGEKDIEKLIELVDALKEEI